MKRGLLAFAIATTTVVGSDSMIARQSTMTGPGLKRSGTAALSLPVPRTFELTHVRPEYFAAALGKDPNRIFQFVRDQIAFEPYVGALRGPRGTLLAMAGNSVDRASLLASMLVAAGQRIRFAHGGLTDALAQQLMASVWVERSWPRSQPEATTPEVKRVSETIKAGVQRDGTMLRDMLHKAGYAATNAPIDTSMLLRQARNHFWVEWWQNGAWTAMDPSFASAVPGQSFAKAAETFDELPEAVFHRVNIRVRVEDSSGDATASHEAVHFEAKTADLSGVDVFLGHQGGQGNEANHVRPFLLVGAQKIDGEWFWLKSPPQNTQVAIVDAFGGGPEPNAVAIAESVEFEFTLPDGTTETVTREIFDRVGRKRRLDQQPLTLDQITAVTRSLVPAQFTAGVYDCFLTTGAIDAQHLENVVAPAPTPNGRADIGAALRRTNVTFAALSDGVLNRLAQSGRVLRMFVDTPRVQIAEFSYLNGRPRFSLDLRRDSIRAIGLGVSQDQLFMAQVLHGVIDGALERGVIEYFDADTEQPGSAPHVTMSTSVVFERAQASAISPVILKTAGSASLVKPSNDAQARIEEALAGGNIVIAPGRPVDVGGAPRFAWWQIDPRSGHTTAVTDEGLHQATVEVRANTDGTATLTYRIDGEIVMRTREASFGRARDIAFGVARQVFLDIGEMVWVII